MRMMINIQKVAHMLLTIFFILAATASSSQFHSGLSKSRAISNAVQTRVDYKSAVYLKEYESIFSQCVKDIGYFSCQNLGAEPKDEQDCVNLLRIFDSCIKKTCFDAEYIESKEGQDFSYQNSYYEYAQVASAECISQKQVVLYASLSQSTRNYIEEYQTCFRRSKVILLSSSRLTNLQSSADQCALEQAQNNPTDWEHSSLSFSQNFRSCLTTKEEQFKIEKSFWNISQYLPAFESSVFDACRQLQPKILPQIQQNYVNCILNSTHSSIIIFSMIALICVCLFL